MKTKSIKKTPLVSIVTINLNNAEGLQKTLDSLAAQTWKNFESVIVDGGSTDGSFEIIKEFVAKKQFKIGKWVSEKDKGLYNAQNKGIKFSRGKYLLFLNSGDYLASADVLEKLKPEKWRKQIIYGNLSLARNGIFSHFRPPANDLDYFLLLSSLPHPASFIQSNVFGKTGFYREDLRICADYDFFLKALFKHRVTTQYHDLAITVFDTSGLSNNPRHARLSNAERLAVQKETLPQSAYAIVKSIRDFEDRHNSFRFALLAIPRYFARRLRKFFTRLK
ncbi:MAG: glycosyltransferase [Flavobacteriales bacterium]|nr:glycosyltransferase [Flavobacteriales bacterium]